MGFRTIILAVLCICLIITDHRSQVLRPVRYFFAFALSPLHFFVDMPVHLSEQAAGNFTTQQSLIQQNAQLQAEKLQLAAQLQKYEILVKENAELLNLSKSVLTAKMPMLIARVLASSSDSFVQQLLIDRGASANLYEGQPVIDEAGLMGQVIYVGPLFSRVMLLTDARSAVPVQIVRNGLRGILIGTGDPLMMQLRYVPVSADVVAGDELVTSGLGEVYPAGYPVGQITRVDKESGDSFAEITVLPKAGINQSELVLLLFPPNASINSAIQQELRAMREANKRVEKLKMGAAQ